MASALTRDDVRHVAKLARLTITEDEVTTYWQELGTILTYANEISNIDTADVEPTSHPLSLENVFREDVPGEVLDRAEVLSQAPDQDGVRFVVPKILGEN